MLFRWNFYLLKSSAWTSGPTCQNFSSIVPKMTEISPNNFQQGQKCVPYDSLIRRKLWIRFKERHDLFVSPCRGHALTCKSSSFNLFLVELFYTIVVVSFKTLVHVIWHKVKAPLKTFKASFFRTCEETREGRGQLMSRALDLFFLIFSLTFPYLTWKNLYHVCQRCLCSSCIKCLSCRVCQLVVFCSHNWTVTNGQNMKVSCCMWLCKTISKS